MNQSKAKYVPLAVFTILTVWFDLLLVGTGLAVAGAASEAPLWPLERSSRYLTSNFMEYRGGRFHAGLDLKTNSQTGYAVRAVEDGYISRLRASPSAYGRVIYQQGVSGKTYVYAHLMRFNDRLQPLVRAAQEAAGAYRTSLSFAAGEIRVKRGDVLGLSGQSGTGGPHLHFEVRDAHQQPINPLSHGFAIPDTFPPVIHSVRAWPADEQSLANGSALEQVISDQNGAGLHGRLPALIFRGPVAFSARLQDAADIRGHSLEPWVIEVRLDEELVYRSSNDVYSFEQNSLQRLEWVEWVDDQQVSLREHWLHRRQANTLPGRQGGLWYLGAKGRGLSPEVHLLTLTVRDHNGGSSTVEVPLVPQVEGVSPSLSWQESPVGLNGISGQRMTPFILAGDFTAPGERLVPYRRSDGDPVLEDFDLLVKLLPEGAPLDLGDQGLQPAGPAAWFLAADWPIDASLTAAFPAQAKLNETVPSGDPRLGVYRKDGAGPWKLVGPLLDDPLEDSRVVFAMEEPGLHAVLRDVLPPVIDSRREIRVGPCLDPGLPEVTMPRWEIIPLALADPGSGLAAESILASLDSQPLVVEPDLPRDRVLVELPSDLEAGSHRFYLEASDEAGNPVSAYFTFICEESSSR